MAFCCGKSGQVYARCEIMDAANVRHRNKSGFCQYCLGFLFQSGSGKCNDCRFLSFHISQLCHHWGKFSLQLISTFELRTRLSQLLRLREFLLVSGKVRLVIPYWNILENDMRPILQSEQQDSKWNIYWQVFLNILE